jgi:hypothetical protein
MAKRPKITKITITYEIDGKSVTKDIDPAETEALFFTDHAVKDILAPFYDPKHPKALKAPKSNPDQVVKEWETPMKSGNLPVVMLKYPGCTETPWG